MKKVYQIKENGNENENEKGESPQGTRSCRRIIINIRNDAAHTSFSSIRNYHEIEYESISTSPAKKQKYLASNDSKHKYFEGQVDDGQAKPLTRSSKARRNKFALARKSELHANLILEHLLCGIEE